MTDLVALDIGINYLGDPWGFYALSREDRTDLFAYWRLQHTNTPTKWLLSRPATLGDLYAILCTEKGKAPRDLFKRSETSDPRMIKHWKKTTGSTEKAISWWLG